MADSSPSWNAVDGVLVINLDTCMQRMEHFRAVNSFLPQEKVHRLSACLGRTLPGFGEAPWFTERTGKRASYWAGAAGCAVSHRRAIETAREKGWKNVLVLEDDVELVPEGGDVLAKALAAVEGDYMLYLGYSRPTPYGRRAADWNTHALWKIEGVLSTFAYLVPESMYDRLLAVLPTEENVWEWMATHRAIDTFYRDVAAEMPGVSIYSILPDIAEHVDDGVSEIRGDVTRNTHSRTLLPYSYATPRGLIHLMTAPLRRLKVKLNSARTLRRARTGGFPGYRNKHS